jgi:hypothetical protein
LRFFCLFHVGARGDMWIVWSCGGDYQGHRLWKHKVGGFPLGSYRGDSLWMYCGMKVVMTEIIKAILWISIKVISLSFWWYFLIIVTCRRYVCKLYVSKIFFDGRTAHSIICSVQPCLMFPYYFFKQVNDGSIWSIYPG